VVTYFLHYLFIFSDGETFISADDLRINLWNLEISNQSFNIVDVKPSNMEDLTGIHSGVMNLVYLLVFAALL
jgi:serine/threonine-protein phosphatase 2A regulatory subunit B